MPSYDKILTISLGPTILFFILSLLSIILTAHYWILGDWINGRWVPVRLTFNERSGKFDTDDAIVDYTESATNATIVSGCLCLTAAVMAGISWFKLRRRDMDSDYNLPLRRFYFLSVLITCTGGASAALSALVLSLTDNGNDEFGCISESFKFDSGQLNTNYMCSRENGACRFLKTYSSLLDTETTVTIACNETKAVKWLQIILLVNALVVMAIFSWQARVRKTGRMRWQRDAVLGSHPKDAL